MTPLERYISHSSVVQRIVYQLKQIYPPGFEGVSLFDSFNFFRKQIFSNKFYTKASAISFSFLMALPPLLLFFFTLIPFLPLPEERILTVMNEIIMLISPNEQLKESVSNMLYNFFHHKKNVLLSFSVILTLYYASNGMMGLMSTFEKRLPGFKARHWLRQRLVAVALTLMLIVATLLAPTWMMLQLWLANSLSLDFMKNLYFIKSAIYLVIFITLLLTISYTYKYGASTDTKLKLISPGAIIATLLIILITFGFFYAVNNLVNYDQIYGSIGTLIIFLVWINLVSQIILVGFELNASIIVNKKRSNK